MVGRNRLKQSNKRKEENNFCIVYFGEVVVANVQLKKEVALDVSHFERSPLNLLAPSNTDPRSTGTIRQFHNWMSVETRFIHN